MNLRNILLVASTAAALLSGGGIAVAQSDNTPGSRFQNQGIREERGSPAEHRWFYRHGPHYRIYRGL